MSDEFLIHNQFKESIRRYELHDPQLKRISGLSFQYCSHLIHEKSFSIPGVYLIAGGRQIGKTTFLKQYILHLLKSKKAFEYQVHYLAGELIMDQHQLRSHIEGVLELKKDGIYYIFIDEISYIKDWDRAIKYLVDTGQMDEVVLILTGSDSKIIKDAMKRFPGRRGRALKTDFTFYPLSFTETILLKNPRLKSFCQQISNSSLKEEHLKFHEFYEECLRYFNEYLIHGGYLTAIKDFIVQKDISASVSKVYLDWIKGDILKHNKSEQYLNEIMRGIVQTYSTQISYNSLAKRMSIDHHKTVADYLEILSDIHAVYILEALNENTKTAALKKNKKIYFHDPFIYHTFKRDIQKNYDIRQGVKQNAPALVETVVVGSCKRYFDTYYIKGNKGEVDIALVDGQKIYPIEVKWTKQLRIEDLKELKRFNNGMVLTLHEQQRQLDNINIFSLIKFLIHIESKIENRDKKGKIICV